METKTGSGDGGGGGGGVGSGGGGGGEGSSEGSTSLNGGGGSAKKKAGAGLGGTAAKLAARKREDDLRKAYVRLHTGRAHTISTSHLLHQLIRDLLQR